MAELPAFNPNISHLKRQAKDLKRAVDQRQAAALARAAAQQVETAPTFGLRSAQLVIARENGHPGWHDLIEAVGQRMVEERDIHRWFGVSLNNQAWGVIESGAVGPSEPPHVRERALYRAFASVYHWMEVGTPIQHGRGEHLISRTAVMVGEPEIGLHHARRYVQIIENHPDLAEDWDRAFAAEALARALAGTGRVGEARAQRVEAERLCALIAEEGERVIVEAELAREPWFGLLASD
ncbi:MAG TPA: hypothetical protein VLA54_14295 [Acidimicrobiia bacterium]|nr:hypothetical protein [Acidimicrobiia bacterium]